MKNNLQSAEGIYPLSGLLKFLLYMKITLIFLILGLTQAVALPGYAQFTKISMNLSNVTVGTVLGEIEKQSEFYFIFNSKLIDAERKVNINIENKKIDKVLEELFRNTNVIFSVYDKKILLSTDNLKLTSNTNEERIQNQKVTGTITDIDKLPIPGVNIYIKGTSTGTISDASGNYSLELPGDNLILVFSSIGYQTQEIPVTPELTILNIILEEEIKNIDEVVIVGYGTQKKINLTGAVDVVSGNELENRAVANMSEALQGLSPNLNITTSSSGGEPGASKTWNIRGISTINGSGSPLVLVDGIQMDPNNVDPEAIASVSVLKDAAASAIYGARAPFGVVLITTKKGIKDGNVNVSYNYLLGLSSPINLPEFESSDIFTAAFNQADANAGNTQTFPNSQLHRIYDHINGLYLPEYDTVSPPYNLWRGRWDGNANNEWMHMYFKKYSTRQKHSINLTGGSGKNQYYLGASYYKQDGQYNWADEYFKRYNLIANLSSKVTDWLKIDFSAKFAQNQTKLPLGPEGSSDRNSFYHEASIFWPTTPYHNTDGSVSNPFVRYLQDGGDDITTANDFWATIGAEIEPIEGWKTNLSYNYNNYNSKRFVHDKIVYVNVPNGSIANIGSSSNKISEWYNADEYNIFNIYSAYEKTLGSSYLKFMAGYEQEEKNYGGLYGSRDKLITNNVPSISTSIGDNILLDDWIGHWATQGFFGRFNYTYNEKILFEANARYDGSSRFSKDNRWGFFPSVSAGYIISKENFWAPVSNIVNTFKVRGSYGSLGNQNVANYLYLSNMKIYQNLYWILGGQRPNYANAPDLVSEDLTWETVTTLDFGFDADFFNNKLSLVFDWYNRTTTDMFGPSESLPAVLGATVALSNNASMSTKGFELILSWKDKINSDLSYNIGLSLADNKSTILKYKNDTKILDNWYEGQNVGEIWGYTTEGIMQNQSDVDNMANQSKFFNKWGIGDIMYRDLDGNDTINNGTFTLDDHGDLSVIGNSLPHFTIGINFGADWKGIDFKMFWQGVLKRDFYVPYSSYSGNVFYGLTDNSPTSTIYKNSDHLNFWRSADEVAGFDENGIYHLGANTDSYFPKPYAGSEHLKNYQTQSRFLINAAYLRLKTMQLGYTIPGNLTQKVKIERLRLYISAENLLTITKVPKILDPEELIGSSAFTESNLEYHGVGKMYPLSKTISFGLNVTF